MLSTSSHRYSVYLIGKTRDVDTINYSQWNNDPCWVTRSPWSSTAQYCTVQHSTALCPPGAAEQQPEPPALPPLPPPDGPAPHLQVVAGQTLHRCNQNIVISSYIDEATNDPSVFTITEKTLTGAFFRLKAPTSTLLSHLRHYAKLLIAINPP